MSLKQQGGTFDKEAGAGDLAPAVFPVHKLDVPTYLVELNDLIVWASSKR